MKIIYLAVSGIALLAWNVASAETKPVNLELRVLVDAPPPCTVTGSAVEFGDVLIASIDGNKLPPERGLYPRLFGASVRRSADATERHHHHRER